MSVPTANTAFHVSGNCSYCDPKMPTPSSTGDTQCSAHLSRWWFASEMCPLLAGTLGPLATGFTICSLTTGWIYMTVRYQDEDSLRILENPTWHMALNAVSVGSGLISNVTNCLFTWSKLSCAISTTALLIQSSILIGLLIATRSSASWLTVPGDYHLTQAYYYAIISTALSMTTLVGVASNGFGLINKIYSKQLRIGSTQANLFRQTIAFITYLLLGSALYAQIENWSFLDAVFWADFTLLTIGLGGEFTPKTALGRGLLLPYAIGGIILIALVVISIQRLLWSGRSRLTDSMAEKSRERLEKRLSIMHGASTSISDENTFNLVRRIVPNAKARCSWMAFAFSVIAAVALLLVGASIFNVWETDPPWTYGVSAYFAYVTLLTIGYGDYIPRSESSKSFFVVWSLLSIPVLTIFINNSVETVYGSVRGLVPLFVRLVRNWRCHKRTVPPSLESHPAVRDPVSHHKTKAQGGPVNAISCSGRFADSSPALALPESGGPSQSQARASCRMSQAQLHLHGYLVARSLGDAIHDFKVEPGKKYSYEEWIYYISLMERTTGHLAFSEETQQNGGLRSTSKRAVGLSSAPSPPSTINWASRGTPILLENEAEWISSWFSIELTELLYALLSQDGNFGGVVR